MRRNMERFFGILTLVMALLQYKKRVPYARRAVCVHTRGGACLPAGGAGVPQRARSSGANAKMPFGGAAGRVAPVLAA